MVLDFVLLSRKEIFKKGIYFMDWQEAQKHWGILADAISELIKKVESEIGSQNFRAVSQQPHG